MDGFERRKERKLENIRQAAFELFSTYGVQKVSIAEIAKKAKVSQVTIYNYFGSKDELIHDVISVLMKKKYEEDVRAIESSLPFPEKIKKFVLENTSELVELDPDFLKIMMSEDPVIRQMAEDFTKQKFIPLLLKLVAKGKEEGYVQHNISDEAVLIFISMFREQKQSISFFNSKQENKQLLQELVKLFFYGILGKPTM